MVKRSNDRTTVGVSGPCRSDGTATLHVAPKCKDCRASRAGLTAAELRGRVKISLQGVIDTIPSGITKPRPCVAIFTHGRPTWYQPVSTGGLREYVRFWLLRDTLLCLSAPGRPHESSCCSISHQQNSPDYIVVAHPGQGCATTSSDKQRDRET